MIEDLKQILRCECKRRQLSTLKLAELSGLSLRRVQRALSIEGSSTNASIWVYEELFHALGIRLKRKVVK